ncbi:TRIO and F-actin-binding protein-like [Geospiza fortis]|uniref:TRIO and F-actin-binding protein-like n=1 Tax=Geospiza fortis TaxID=48883 RepID=A0A8N5ETR6_GEOFO|nr:TRIO and F-actin-binding protein-like [Geospiza fortis]
MIHSFSLNSLDSKSSCPMHKDSNSRDVGRGAEKSGRPLSFKASRQYTTLADVPKAIRISNREAFQVERKRLERRTRARSPGREEVARLFGNERRSCCSPPSPAVLLCDVSTFTSPASLPSHLNLKP